jgi:hypothetical protein
MTQLKKTLLLNEIIDTTIDFVQTFEDPQKRKEMFDNQTLYLKSVYADMLWIQDCAEKIKRGER